MRRDTSLCATARSRSRTHGPATPNQISRLVEPSALLRVNLVETIHPDAPQRLSARRRGASNPARFRQKSGKAEAIFSTEFPQGTPPEACTNLGWQVSWLMDRCFSPPSRYPAAPRQIGVPVVSGGRLSIHSCGGSCGFSVGRKTPHTPHSLFTFEHEGPSQ
jgi:hypothetical protein